MSINEFQRLEFQWKQLSEAMLIKLTDKGLQQFQATAVANSLGNNNKSLYLEAVATFFELKTSTKFGVRRPKNLEDPLLAAHIKQARKIKIDTINNLLDYLVFMILHKEQQMRRPGTLGTDLAARMMQSLASLKKDATLLISSINKQIDLQYEVEEERRKQKVLSLGSLVEDLKKNGLDNRLSLSTEIKDLLMLKRNIEEINFDSKRFIRNLTIEDFKCENAIKSLSVGSISDQGIECMLQKRKLHLQYRPSNAKYLLDDICNANIVKLTVPQTLLKQVSNLQSSGDLTTENILSLLVDREDVDFDQLSIAQFFPPLLPSTGIEEPLVDLIELIDEDEIVVEDNLLELD
ncbi:hypothetical protein BD560DRAFT_440591 [Blakeslea trispora]|nr:hypothetical protein BD560DRAFT_440591 [Blakeslea trispora]